MRWPFQALLTISGIWFALLTASDLPTMGIIVVIAAGLDVLRARLPFSRLPADFPAEIARLGQEDRKTVMRRTRVGRWIRNAIPLAGVVIGQYYAAHVPLPDPDAPAAATALPADSWIMHISRLCRTIVDGLTAHGFAERALDMRGYVEVAFVLTFGGIVVGCFYAARQIALAWGGIGYQASRSGSGTAVSFRNGVLFMEGLAAVGCAAANNLGLMDWGAEPGHRGLADSNLWFLSYCAVMGGVAFLIVNACAAAMLYAAGLDGSAGIVGQAARDQP